MTLTTAIAFSKLLAELIRFLQKKGGNRDTFILNKLTECRDELIREYSHVEFKSFK